MAARSVEEILRNYLGDQTLNMIKMQAELERLQALDEMHQQELVAKTPIAKPNGRDPAVPPVVPGVRS